MSETTIVVVSDMHVGSKYAVCTPTAQLTQPNEESLSGEGIGIYKASKLQKALYRAWCECVDAWKGSDILVVNGEPIDGVNSKDPNTVWSTSIIDQMTVAKNLLEMFSVKKIYLTRGSNYHVSIAGQPVEEFFGQWIGAQKVGSTFAPDILNLKIHGKIINFAHHLSTSYTWAYRSTPLAKEMAHLKMNRSHFFPKGLDADVIVRSHNHYFWAIMTTSHLGIQTPAWKVEDWYMRQKGVGNVGDIGAIRLSISRDGTIDFEKKTFKIEEARPPIVEVNDNETKHESNKNR